MKTIFLACAMLCCCAANAQTLTTSRNATSNVRRIEVEIGGGVVFGASKLNFDNVKPGGMGFAEVRYNFSKLPFDVGFYVAGNVFHRAAFERGNLGFTSVNCLAVSDYNLFCTKNVSFFAGLGVGLAWHENAAPIGYLDKSGYVIGGSNKSFCFMPRVGVELFQHLRLTADYKFEEKANRHFNIAIGVVFGGGRKK